MRYKTFWKRLGATIIDELILLPISWVGSYIDLNNNLIFIIWILFSSILYTLYFVCLHGNYGQTLGKKLFNIKVIDLDEKNIIGIKRALLRESPWIIAQILGLAYIAIKALTDKTLDIDFKNNYEDFVIEVSLAWLVLELITMLTNSKRRALHDYLAKSVVIRVK